MAKFDINTMNPNQKRARLNSNILSTVHRGKDPKENLQRYVRELEQQLTHVQQRLRGKKLQVNNLHKQLKEREQREENSQRQLREIAQQLERLEEERRQQLANFQDQLREKEENSQRQLREVEEQLKEKDEQKENLQRQLGELEQQLENSERLSRESEQQLTHFQRQLQQKELQEASLHEQLREKEQQEENLQRQTREIEQQRRNLEVQLREKEQESANLHQQVATQEERLRVNEQRVNELEVTLSTAQQAFSEQQRRQSPDWAIPRDQIQLTDKVLGRGGWGSVVEGKYCGCAVAVKQIHELILSPHNRSLFEREMDIASKCRHPCLLQFIGATNDEGNPLFLTELLESSLRALLEQRSLSAAEVSIISLDVARALSYLHHKTHPIIHRDISSANVLLWRQGDQWRGKVSDYGTANFMQHTTTVAPGAMIYMAPEALTSNQTVKVSNVHDLIEDIIHLVCCDLRWPDTIYLHVGYIFESRVLA